MTLTFRRAFMRVTGNFLISFATPLVGTQAILQPEFIQSIYVALVSSSIVTIIVVGQILDKASKVGKDGKYRS